MVLIVGAVALGCALLFLVDDDDAVEEDPVAALPEPVETDDGWTVQPVGWAPGATALSAVDGSIVATDTDTGARYAVVDPSAAEPQLAEPEPFGATPRVERAVTAPGGDDLWVAEGSELLRLDDAGEALDTIPLAHPSSIVAVTDDAVWLTVSGIPVADETGIVAPRSVVQRVDVATGDVLAVPVDDPVDFHLSVTGDAVWATVGQTLLRLDPTTVEPIAEVGLDGTAAALLADGSGAIVVVAGEQPAVVRVDQGGQVTETRALASGDVAEAALVAGGDGDELWVLRPDGDAIDRLLLGDGDLASVEIEDPRRIEVTDDGVWLLGGADDGLVLVARPAS
jgi:hypothetical protein